MEERRRSTRAVFREALEYRTQDRENLIGSVGYDISEGGVRFQSDDFIPLHAPLFIRMALSPNQSIDLHGRVVWVQMVPHSERYHIGLEFDDSDSMVYSKKLIREYIKSRQSA